MITGNLGVAVVLFGVPAFYFLLQHRTGWKIFDYLPPLLWIYATPVLLRGVDILPDQSDIYKGFKLYLLPFFITLLVVSVDLKSAMKALKTTLPLMFIATAGVMVGGPIAYFIVAHWLEPSAWSGYGALAGSWIGGTANMAAASVALDTPAEQLGLAILADQAVYFVWLPLLIVSKNFAGWFNRWTNARELVLHSSLLESEKADWPPMLDVLLVSSVGLTVTWASLGLADMLPDVPPVLSQSTWRIVLITTAAIGLSFTPLRKSAQAVPIATALLYVFVANMGASASIEGLGQAPAFLVGAFIWILIHGLFCLAGAKIFRMDVHIMAIASAANIGGAASAPVVAAAHNRDLVPLALLMAMVGYVFGNYLAIIVGQLCRIIVS